MLATVQAAYGRPVDIEFAWDEDKLYVLQCRSLSLRREMDRVVIPMGVPAEDTLFVTHTGLSNAVVPDIEYIVYVDPRAYDRLDTVEKKHKVGWAVGQLNKRLAGQALRAAGPRPMGEQRHQPGRARHLSDINNTRLLVEIAFARDGYTPEVSYGTHFFQDLVEADIAIMPLYPDTAGNSLNEQLLLHGRQFHCRRRPRAGGHGGGDPHAARSRGDRRPPAPRLPGCPVPGGHRPFCPEKHLIFRRAFGRMRTKSDAAGGVISLLSSGLRSESSFSLTV